MFMKCLLLIIVLCFVEAASSCPVPRIKNGRARPRQRGTFLKYSCSVRYTLVGNKYATCRFGQWDVPPPVCVKTGCQQLEEVKNAVNMTSHNNAWVVFFCLPGHQLAGSPVIYCDGSQWNSTAPVCYDSSAKNAETECDFEQPDICGWKPDEYHDFDWRRLNKKTPSSFLQTGPSFDHTYGKNGSGYYMYVESTGRVANETARLMSPVYEADLARNGCFVFWYHMYGRSMGGLTVYQKPDKVSMYQLLLPIRAQNYTLFQQWGDQGNEWYSAVGMLSDVGDNFQIVIEGIRGESFMSDVAIDDVSIQHGENCSKAMMDATTPPSVLQESCVGRCDLYAEATGYRGCSCSIVCVVTQNCCPDFLDVCDFDARTSSEDYSRSNSSVAPPQTQKLIATTTEIVHPTTTTSTTTSTTYIPTTTTKRPPPVVRTTTTTTTTKRPATRTTTNKPTPTTTTTTTTTTKTTTRMTTPKRPVPKTTTSTSTTAVKPIFTRKSTTLTLEVSPMSSSTIFFVRTTIHDDGIKPIDQKNTEKGTHDKVVGKKTGGMSGGTVAITVLLVGVACVGVLWVAYVMTRSRGVAALARIRGRTTSDPEVHYLKSDIDDDDE